MSLSTIFQVYRGLQFVLVEETGRPGENHWHVASYWQNVSHNVVHIALIEIRTHNTSGDRHWSHRQLWVHLPSRPRRPLTNIWICYKTGLIDWNINMIYLEHMFNAKFSSISAILWSDFFFNYLLRHLHLKIKHSCL